MRRSPHGRLGRLDGPTTGPWTGATTVGHGVPQVDFQTELRWEKSDYDGSKILQASNRITGVQFPILKGSFLLFFQSFFPSFLPTCAKVRE